MTDAQILQVYGMIFLAMGIGLAVRPQYAKDLFDEMFRSAPFMFLFSMIAAVIGFLILTRSGVSAGGWSILVTAIGVIALVKGLTGLALPQLFEKLAKPFVSSRPVLALSPWLILLAGVLMAYIGFFAA
jgi:hypothetical protein